MTGADLRRWVHYYQEKNEKWEQIQWQIAQLTSLIARFSGLDTVPEDWMPFLSAENAPAPEVHLSDRELAIELARSFGAEIRYV